jgi:hypothetical protein
MIPKKLNLKKFKPKLVFQLNSELIWDNKPFQDTED